MRLPAPIGVPATLTGFEDVRLNVDQAEASLAAAADRLSLPRSAWGAEDYNILAISGGAAGGAFGAGALVGLTRAGARPRFAIVTGVSTGALIAPFALLGSEWDDRLEDAYCGGHAANLLSIGGLGAFTGALFRAEALDQLITPFVDEAMIDAVGAAHREGRRLLVATTDLDQQTTCIWDMGAIASRGGDEAVKLFRQVLAASASLPGIFPPRRFACEHDGVAYEEMHVDGGVTAPLFVMPDALMRWNKLRRRLSRGRVHVIVNTPLEPTPRTTASNMPSILVRSFETMLRNSYRQALEVAGAYCAGNRLPLSVASLSPQEGASMMNFDTAAMRRIFDEAAERAVEGRLWRAPPPQDTLTELLTGFRNNLAGLGPG